MRDQGTDVFLQLVPMLVFSLMVVPVAYKLAKEKGRNVALWMILGAIPIVNFIFLWFFIGAANLRLERKIDELSKHIAEGRRPPSG